MVKERVVAIHALRPLARSLGHSLTGASTLAVLDHWSANHAALQAVVAAFSSPGGAALKTERALPDYVSRIAPISASTSEKT